MNNELRNIISGNSTNTEKNLIQTTLLHIRKSERASGKIEKQQLFNKKNIFLEDLHDENVLINHGVFFFIDTVNYIIEDFF